MTSHTGRLYAAAAGLLTFFVLWAGIAAHPWRSAAADSRLTALAQRQQLLRREAVLVRQIVQARAAAAKAAAQIAQQRAAAAKVAAQARQVAAVAPAAVAPAAVAPAAVAPAPVRVVTLPPLVVTRTS